MFLPKLSASQFTKLISLDPWEIMPVTIEEFVLSPNYLDLGSEIYPRIFETLLTIFGNNPKEMYVYNDINFIGGIGCLAGDSKIIDHLGKIHYIKNLVNEEIEIFAYNEEKNKLVQTKAIGKYSGKKNIVKIITESGREIKCTENHLFLSDNGWVQASKLLNRSILVANKLPFKTEGSYNIPNNLKTKITNKQEKDLFSIATYNSNALKEFIKDIKTTENDDYEIFTYANSILRTTGLRTGEIFSKEQSSIIKFKHTANLTPPTLFDKVIFIEKLNNAVDVYDLEVPECENFILYDGTIVHNSGKTYLGSIAQTYIFEKLCCLKNPRLYLGAGEDKPISLVNCAPSANKAQKLVFQGIKENILRCPFFKKFDLFLQSREIKKFNSNKNLEVNIVSGSSTPNSVIGLNVYSAINDESAFFARTEEKDYYEEMEKGLKNRITSRFQDRGFYLSITSPMNVDDYVWQKFIKMKKEGQELIIPKHGRIRELAAKCAE